MQGLIINKDVKIGQYSSKGNDLINEALERLLFIEIEDQIGSLDQGSRILDYMHEGLTQETALGIMEEIKFLIETYEPRIILNAVGVDLIPIDGSGAGGIIIYINYSKINEPERQEIVEFTKVNTIK